METENEKKSVAKQIVVNVSEVQKNTIQQLKEDYGLTDKGVITLLLEVAFNNQVGLLPDDNGDAQEVDTFAIIVDGLGIAKKSKADKIVITDEEKAAIKESKRQDRLRKKLEELTKQLAAEVTAVEEEIETLVVSGV
jgi:hypothetical protein